MSSRKKIYKDYIKDLITYEKKIKNEILSIDQDYPVLYSSQKEVKDSIVEDLYKSLNIQDLPKYYFANFGKNRITLGLFDGNAIYINEEYWSGLPIESKKNLILHELGHWVGLRHTKDDVCLPARTNVMCGSTPDFNEGHIAEYRYQFVKDLPYLYYIKNY